MWDDLGEQTENLIGDRYQIGERVREGRAFRVHEALDTRTGDTVRARVLRPFIVREPGVRVRFRRLMEIAPPPTKGRLGLVAVEAHLDTIVVIEARPKGRSLADVLVDEGVLEPRRAKSLVLAIASIVAGLHSEGLPHGLLSPQEIHVEPSGAAEIGGIGLCGAFGREGVPGAEMNPYLAPEQRRGELAVLQSDVWALGVMLVESITGRCPTVDELDGGGWKRGVPGPLVRLLERVLAPLPQNRFSTAAAFAEALASVDVNARPASSVEPSPAPAPSGSLPPPPVDARPPRPAEPTARRSEPLVERPLTFGMRTASCVTWLVCSLIIPLAIALPIYTSWERWKATAPEEVVVPDLQGSHMRLEDARQAAGELGLKLQIVDRPYDATVEEGAILWQNPPGGKVVKEGRTIDVMVSQGARAVKVPNVTNLSEDEAITRLKAEYLTVGDITRGHDPKYPEGVVLGQSPAQGRELQEGGSVNLLVSAGPDPNENWEGIDQAAEGSRPGSVESFTVPKGNDTQLVEIRVTDEKGARTVYRDLHQPGDRVRRSTYPMFGKATVELIIDGVVTSTQVSEPPAKVEPESAP